MKINDMTEQTKVRYFAITDWEDVIDLGYHPDIESADEAAEQLQEPVIWLMSRDNLFEFIGRALTTIKGEIP